MVFPYLPNLLRLNHIFMKIYSFAYFVLSRDANAIDALR